MHAQPVFYVEMKMDQINPEVGTLAVGFALPSHDMTTTLEYGYRSDGLAIMGDPKAPRAYGPSYFSGDLIGCGYNFKTRDAFFTKNSVFLGAPMHLQSVGS
jgi:hypothetical protein